MKLIYTNCILDGIEIKHCKGIYQNSKSHLHNELSIGLIKNGSTNVLINNEKFHLKKNDGILIPPHTSHMCKPLDVSNWEFIMIYVNSKIYKNLFNLKYTTKLTIPITSKLDTFIKEINSTEKKFHLKEFLINLLFEMEKTQPIQNPVIKNTSSIHAIKTKEHLTKNFKNTLNLNILEKNIGINKFSIIRSFKYNYNTTPISFQLQLKLAYAKNLLALNTSVFEICNLLNFYDQSHFIREFKKMYGTTPNKYIKNLTLN
jgi:AraC-like DNA-binding protein